MRIACLHTADSNIGVFEQAAASLKLEHGQLHHSVHDQLLASAEDQGYVSPALINETQYIIADLLAHADAVLITCSTLGAVADQMTQNNTKPVLRSDRALAENALQTGKPVTVLCTAPTTLIPTTDLFRQVFAQAASQPDILLIDGAWALFRAGEHDAYNRMIAQTADAVYAQGDHCIALAQSSMAGACALLKSGQIPLDAPTAALRQCLKLI